MKMNTKSRVAIAAILDIAVHGTSRPVCIADISERQHVSVSYLEQLFQKLRQSSFVASFRGPGGGYRLSRSLASISVADVIGVVDGESFGRNPCAGTDRCDDAHACVTNGLWCRVNSQLHDYLRSISLASVLADASAVPDSCTVAAVSTPMSGIGRVPFMREEGAAVALA